MKKKVVRKKVKKVWSNAMIKWFTAETEMWIKKYRITNWIVTTRFEEKDRKPDKNWWFTAADTDANPTYMKASIAFYPAILENDKDRYNCEKTINDIKHELCHLLTEKFYNLACDRYATKKQLDDEIETLTQTIAVIT